jgi:hypothetical protein
MRKAIIAVTFLIAVLIAAALWRHGHQQPEPVYEIARAKANHITVWNSTAQIREPVAMLNFGERVDVLQKYADQVNVKTPAGVSGWVDERELISQEVWQRATALMIQAGRMPIQASGRTRVPANLHLDPGRIAPMLVELSRDVPVQMLERRVVTPGSPGAPKNALQPSSVTPSEIRDHAAPATTIAATVPTSVTEEWWLIRTEVKDLGPAAGWTLGRFIALTAPDPLPDYSAAANMRLIAWFILNRVPDNNGGDKPQYLAAGLRPGEGGDYDFSLLRVYTWGTKRARYETAYVEDNLRGKLPIRVTPASSLGGDSEFRFTNAGADGNSEFVYQMKQTSVRRIQGGAQHKKPHARSGSKSHVRPHAKPRAKSRAKKKSHAAHNATAQHQ